MSTIFNIGMKKTTLRRRIRFFILLPLLAGAVVTALVSIAPIFIQYPAWIDRFISDIVNAQGDVMLEVSHQVGELSSGFLQIPIYYVVLVGKLIQKYYDGDLSMKTDLSYLQNFTEFSAMVNSAYALASQQEPIMYNQSMWYYQGNTTLLDMWNNWGTGSQQLSDCVEFDSFMLPISSNIGGDRISGFYYGFNASGLYYMSPSQSLPFFLNATTSCGEVTEQYFDPRCRPWFSTVVGAPERALPTIIAPYLRIEDRLVMQDACYGVWNDDDFNLAVCIGFTIISLDNQMKNTSLAKGGESFGFVMNRDGTVFSFPGYNRQTGQPLDVETLIFGDSKSSEAVAFSSHIAPYFTNGTRALAKYQKSGSNWLIAIQPIEVDMGTDQLHRRDLSAAVVMRESVLWEQVDELKKESNNILIIESVVLFGFLIAMMAFGWM